MGKMRHEGKMCLGGWIEFLQRFAKTFLSGALPRDPLAFGCRCDATSAAFGRRIVEQCGDLRIYLGLLVGCPDLLDGIANSQEYGLPDAITKPIEKVKIHFDLHCQ